MRLHHEEIRESLTDYLNGRVPEELAREMEKHLASCQECADELSLLGELKSGDIVPGPGEFFFANLPSRVGTALKEEKSPWFRTRLVPALAFLAVVVLAVVIVRREPRQELPYTDDPLAYEFMDYGVIEEEDVPEITISLNGDGAFPSDAEDILGPYLEGQYETISSLSAESLRELNEELEDVIGKYESGSS